MYAVMPTRNRINVLLARKNAELLENGQDPLSLAEVARKIGVKDESTLWRHATHKTKGLPYDLVDRLMDFFNLSSYDELFVRRPDEPAAN